MISQFITLLIHKNAFIYDISIGRAFPPLQPVPCLTASLWLPLRSGFHRCPSSDFGPGRLAVFSCLRSLRSFRLHCARSGPKPVRLPAGPQNPGGVRSAHRAVRSLQDCPGGMEVELRSSMAVRSPVRLIPHCRHRSALRRQTVGVYINIIQA